MALARRSQQGAQICDVGFGGTFGSQACRQCLQALAHREHVRDGGRVRQRDERTATRDHDDEPLGLHHPQRLPDRVAGNPEVRRKPILGQALTRRVVAVDDALAQRDQHLVAQRHVLTTDRVHCLDSQSDQLEPYVEGSVDHMRSSRRLAHPLVEVGAGQGSAEVETLSVVAS